ncbi:MAG: tRNA (adenosine(37)-N6)-threonylcarbamoyltransferase complex ATPase subunit type 1 TsaE [Planctomycetota bacterium]|nr:MAG: tRNA (adenosine(37)-N6)-threonylcarbamoyltransferase complex ATPase subunit type 1 TsaE [Planctomycetota bacterium]
MAAEPSAEPASRELGVRVSASPEETEQLAERIGRLAHAGLVVALDGELGAGKTCFVRGFARGLDAHEPVTSPTYALQHVYLGRHELWHFDAWRAGQGAALLAELGPEELGRGSVVVVEWAARVRELLPAPRLEVELAHVSERERRLSFAWRGAHRPATQAERAFADAIARILREPDGAPRVGSAALTGKPPDEPPREDPRR